MIITAAVTGAAAAVAFDIPFEEGFLIGAVIAPTDPAILIPLFERLQVRPKVVQTVIAESALNDPTGAVLALTIAAFILEGGGSGASAVGDFVSGLAISTALGIVLGLLLALVVSERRFGDLARVPRHRGRARCRSRLRLHRRGRRERLLGAFIAGPDRRQHRASWVSACRSLHGRRSTSSRRLTADIVVLLVFIVVGGNLPLGTMADNLLPALAVLAILLFVARPLTVLACLLPDRRGRWTRNEMVFVGWTRETGVVPAAVAGLLLAMGVPNEDEMVTVLALAIVVTLGLQATTKAWLAERLGLLEQPAMKALEEPDGARPPAPGLRMASTWSPARSSVAPTAISAWPSRMTEMRRVSSGSLNSSMRLPSAFEPRTISTSTISRFSLRSSSRWTARAREPRARSKP